MGTTLYAANRQWADRPDDERFGTLQELYEATHEHFTSAATYAVPYRSLSAVPIPGDDVVLAGPGGAQAKFTNYSFGQLARAVGAPANYLAKLPAEKTADLLNYGLQQRAADDKAHILLHRNGSLIFRAVTGMVYNRIWNYQVAEFCLRLAANNSAWRVPPARPARDGQAGTRVATEADVLDISAGGGVPVKVGDLIAPANSYASAHDLFVFMMNVEKVIDAGNGEILHRGFFVSNSEVGAASLKFTLFLAEGVCGNAIIWNTKDVAEISLRHVGSALEAKVQQAQVQVQKAIESSAVEDEARIRSAKSRLLGDSKEEVIELIADKNGIFSRKEAELIYVEAENNAHIHGDSRTPWGFAAGATRYSQTVPYGDKRNEIDRKAGLVLPLAA